MVLGSVGSSTWEVCLLSILLTHSSNEVGFLSRHTASVFLLGSSVAKGLQMIFAST